MEDSIDKCKRCPEVEALAESYRVALIEAAKILDYILAPATTDADRAEIRRRAFGDLSAPPQDSGVPGGVITPPSAGAAPSTS